MLIKPETCIVTLLIHKPTSPDWKGAKWTAKSAHASGLNWEYHTKIPPISVSEKPIKNISAHTVILNSITSFGPFPLTIDFKCAQSSAEVEEHLMHLFLLLCVRREWECTYYWNSQTAWAQWCLYIKMKNSCHYEVFLYVHMTGTSMASVVLTGGAASQPYLSSVRFMSRSKE